MMKIARNLSLMSALALAAPAMAGDGRPNKGAPKVKPAERGCEQAWGISWRTSLALASKEARRGKSRPILHWRVLGELNGLMGSAGHSMRTRTFSSPGIRELINERFVASYANCEGEASVGRSRGHAPSDTPGPCVRGAGGSNVQLYVLTPKGAIFHVVSGAIDGEALKSELRFALELFDKLRSSRRARARRLVRQAHAARLRARARAPGAKSLLGSMSLSRQRMDGDDQLMVDHPLLPWRDFKPVMLKDSTKGFVSAGGKISGGGLGGGGSKAP